MKRIVKKILPFLLFLTGFLPVIFTLFFLFKQQLIRHEMKEKMENQLLCTIELPESKVEWVKYKKEIRVADKLFDIKSFTLKNGSYTFTGLYDDDETALLEQLQKDQKNNTANSKQLVQFFQLLQSFYNSTQVEIVITENISGGKFIPGTSALASPFISIFTPPPRVS